MNIPSDLPDNREQEPERIGTDREPQRNPVGPQREDGTHLSYGVEKRKHKNPPTSRRRERLIPSVADPFGNPPAGYSVDKSIKRKSSDDLKD